MWRTDRSGLRIILSFKQQLIYCTGKYVGVNSFGFGGVNGHVILEPYSDVNKEEFVQGICKFISREEKKSFCSHLSSCHILMLVLTPVCTFYIVNVKYAW